jgi:hypothetical protein
MLFYVDISHDDLTSVPPATLTDAVTDLVVAHRRGHHLVVISRSTASWLLDNTDLSNRDAAMLARISSDFAQTGDLRRRARMFVSLSANEALNLAVDGNVITVSLKMLVQYHLLDQPIFLVENMDSDGRVYRLLFDTHRALHNCSRVSFDLHHGGGDNLPMVFGQKIGERRIVCGVVDSDRISPLSPNKKLEALAKIREELAWPLCFPVSPPCREAENAVPMELVMALPSGHKNPANALHLEISNQEVAQGHSLEEYFWLFFDLKEGMSAARFAKLAPDDKAWLDAKLNLCGVKAADLNIGGYGDSIIRQIFADNKFVGELAKLTRRQNWRTVFSPFLEEVLWILVSTSRIVT